MVFRPATPLSVLLLGAFVLLLLSTLSTPIIGSINIATFGGVKFGVFGWCSKRANTCSGVSFGYNMDQILRDEGRTDFALPSGARNSLTNLLIVHPIAALLTLILFILSVLSHLHGPAHSPKYLLALLILCLPTVLASLLAFLVDILIFLPHVQWGGWIVLAATILIVISGIVMCSMRRQVVGRIARSKRIQANAENNPNYFSERANMAPTDTEDKQFATFEETHTAPIMEGERIPLNPRVPQDDSSFHRSNTLRTDGSGRSAEHYGPPPRGNGPLNGGNNPMGPGFRGDRDRNNNYGPPVNAPFDGPVRSPPPGAVGYVPPQGAYRGTSPPSFDRRGPPQQGPYGPAPGTRGPMPMSYGPDRGYGGPPPRGGTPGGMGIVTGLRAPPPPRRQQQPEYNDSQDNYNPRSPVSPQDNYGAPYGSQRDRHASHASIDFPAGIDSQHHPADERSEFEKTLAVAPVNPNMIGMAMSDDGGNSPHELPAEFPRHPVGSGGLGGVEEEDYTPPRQGWARQQELENTTVGGAAPATGQDPRSEPGKRASESYYEDVAPQFDQPLDRLSPPPTSGSPHPTTLTPGLGAPPSGPLPGPPPPNPAAAYGPPPHLRQQQPGGWNAPPPPIPDDMDDGQRSPISTASGFTSISQRGVNPAWEAEQGMRGPAGPRGPPGPGRGGYGMGNRGGRGGYNGAGQGDPRGGRGNVEDLGLVGNPNFELPTRGTRGGRGGGFR
ncbi:SUR7/PalI family-domain-containing protein [Pyronema omphalodes]|nr:SUR7/PalI family-domain-containing protein [Pyronema omphalodes]